MITDPRDLSISYPKLALLEKNTVNPEMLQPPLPIEEARRVELVKGPNVALLPVLDRYPETLQVPILLVVGDDLSTDEILPAGARVLPYRSNIAKISEFAFEGVDSTYPKRAASEKAGHAILAGKNYGQGSSREHAALATRFLGLRLVLAQSFARIHWENLINFGVLPLTFQNSDDANSLSRGDVLLIDRVADQLAKGALVTVGIGERSIRVRHALSKRQRAILQAGGLINWMRERRTS